MTQFSGRSVWALYESSLRQAKANLAGLKVHSGVQPRFAGLNGWVLEQTIQHCIRREMKAVGVELPINEQVGLGGRAKVDLVVGQVAIEIKAGGLFGLDDVRKYRQYRKLAEQGGYRYMFVTGAESHKPYRDGIIDALGPASVVFLDEPGQWERFVDAVLQQGGAKGGSRGRSASSPPTVAGRGRPRR